MSPMRTGRRRSLLAALLVASTVAVLPMAMTAVGAQEVYPTPGNVEIRGRGFGHGRGMSQYGAFRAASIGQSAAAITNRYYSGTTLGSIGNPLLRVRIQTAEGDSGAVFATTTGLRVRDEQTGVERAIDAGAIPVATSLWRVQSEAAGLRVQYRDSGGAWHNIGIGSKDAFAGPIRMFNNATGTVGIGDASGGSIRTYRGSMRTIRATSSTVSLVNIVPLESYLRSVIPSEMPSSWPAEALKAQAIAARSYSGWHLQNPRGSTYDICDTQSCQVYSGTANERPTTDSAAAATAGQARMMGSAVVRTEFSSSNGGWVAAGGSGHAGAGYDAWSDGTWDPSHSWTFSASRATLGSLVGAGYTLESLTVVSRDGRGDWGGRVTSVRLTARSSGGTVASATVTGDDLRRALGLRSTQFTITTSNDVRWQTAAGLGTNTTWSTHTFGPKGAYLLVGDWDGDGTATPAILTAVSNEWRWREGATNAVGAPEFDFYYGPTSCKPVAGDWDGNGTDSPGLACPNGSATRWRLSNTNAVSAPAIDFSFGPSGGKPVVGDWDGAGPDRVGIVTPSGPLLLWQLRAANSAGAPSWSFTYGNAADRVVPGDWDNNGSDTPGVARGTGERWTWYVRNGLSSGPHSAFLAGLVEQTPLVGQGQGQPAHPVVAS